MPTVARIARMFDLAADVTRIEGQLCADKELARLVCARRGLRVPGCWDPFELGVRAILGQQVSVAAASTLAGRLVRSLGFPLRSSYAGLEAIFPSPEAVAGADLRPIGIPGDRAEAIRRFAAAVADQTIRLDGSRPAADVTAMLQELPGIGNWTAEYIAMRGLGEPDAFPASDLGIRRRLSRAGVISVVEIARRAEAWRPWRAYAAIHLWMDGHELKNGRN
jgi:3-methyladenine DNA glycosylase/8-oxoguanine DNA glycosylase